MPPQIKIFGGKLFRGIFCNLEIAFLKIMY